MSCSRPRPTDRFFHSFDILTTPIMRPLDLLLALAATVTTASTHRCKPLPSPSSSSTPPTPTPTVLSNFCLRAKAPNRPLNGAFVRLVDPWNVFKIIGLWDWSLPLARFNLDTRTGDLSMGMNHTRYEGYPVWAIKPE